MTISILSTKDDYSSYNFLEEVCTQGDITVLCRSSLFCCYGEDIDLYNSDTIVLPEKSVMMYLGSKLVYSTQPYESYGMYIYFLHDSKIVYDGYDLKNPEDYMSKYDDMKKLFYERHRNISSD